jgi:hypothetical protein
LRSSGTSNAPIAWKELSVAAVNIRHMDYPTRDEIRSLCTGQSFQRGSNYYNHGRIQALTIDDGNITATVRGTHTYEVDINVATDPIYTYCSCPYDYAGDCKHIVAVLLAVTDTDNEPSGREDSDVLGETSSPSDTPDVRTLVEQATAEDLRTFLLDVIENDRDLRDRFVAFAGGDTGKTVDDYKQEINRLFENAVGRRGMIEYNTHIDVLQYHDLAEIHRARGNVTTATDIYRALAESIREHLNRIDDSGGYYGRELERAVESYADTVSEQLLDHDEKQPYIEYLFEAFIAADYAFVRDDYEDALRTLCTTTADLEYWRDLLDPHVPTLSIEQTAIDAADITIDTTAGQTQPGDETRTSDDTEPARKRTDDTLFVSDFTDGPLTIDDFTGGRSTWSIWLSVHWNWSTSSVTPSKHCVSMSRQPSRNTRPTSTRSNRVTGRERPIHFAHAGCFLRTAISSTNSTRKTLCMRCTRRYTSKAVSSASNTPTG